MALAFAVRPRAVKPILCSGLGVAHPFVVIADDSPDYREFLGRQRHVSWANLPGR